MAVAVATGYYWAARLGFVLRFPPATTSVLWPPNALLTAVLLLTPPRLWALSLLALLPAHLLVEVQAGLPIPLLVTLYVTNCVEALMAATLLRRWSDAPDRFDSLRRAILANAQAASRLLRDSHAPGSAELREILSDIESENRRAGEVIRRLRDLLRKGETPRVRLEVNALVREVVALLRSDALIRGISVRLELHPGRLTIWGDRVQLQQVLINAMEAMTDAGVKDGVVHLRTEAVDEAGIRIGVEDGGPGLRSPTTALAFEPFYTTKPNGLGMGLSIARSIAAAHGGTVEAENNPDRGATFTLVLPAADARVSAVSPALAIARR